MVFLGIFLSLYLIGGASQNGWVPLIIIEVKTKHKDL